MKQKNEIPVPPPARKELSDNPIKFCNEIARLFRHRLRENDHREGVMSQQGAHLILAMLAVQDGINQLELVRATHLRAPTVSVILKNMEAEGLVERRSNPEDLRSVKVYLTQQGRLLDCENIQRIQTIEGIALKGLTEEEQRSLMALLPKIRDNLLAEDAYREGEESV
ncbi:MAG: MarR family transcriptional regulator [Clostridia bacterium]|nr:MarR family transcriptional regulator [Clostridia bacterium]